MMKKLFLPLLIGAALLLFASSDIAPYYHGQYIPIFMDYADLQHSVSYKAEARPLTTTGKIYYKHPYIYINEKYKGVHIINNTDPSAPRSEGFIIAPGCIDMAVKDNIIYLDNSVDLVAFNLDTKQVAKRIAHIFPEPLSPDGDRYYGNDDTKVIVGWRKR